MKYIKMLGLAAAVAAVAAMAFAVTASATTITAPSGTTYTGKIVAEAQGGGIVTHNQVETFTCQGSVAEGTIEKHGAGVTASGKVTKWTLSECNATFNILKPGTLEIHATGSGNGTVTSTGMEIEAIGKTMTCIYTTNETDIGVLTGNNSSNATADLNSAKVPRTGGSPLCGTTGTITGSYKITSPSTLSVD